MENTKQSPPSMIKYLRNRYKNDEEYRNKQIENAKSYYELNKEEILNRYTIDEDFRKRKSQYSKKWYQKIKAKKEEEKRQKEQINNIAIF